jgi:low affinity Fe/Cu permease
VQTVFSRFAREMSKLLGHPLAFGMAVLIIIVWAITGPVFHFSDTWQLGLDPEKWILRSGSFVY